VRAPGGLAVVRPDPCFQPGTQSVNGRVVPSPDYHLGSGDLLEVQVTGRLDGTRHVVSIDPEGLITIPTVGSVEVGNLTLRDANRRITERVRALFRHGDVGLAIVSHRCFEVVLSGEIERPGSIQAAAVRRVHEVILAAGGITPRGSLRQVQVRRGDRETEVDLLRFELLGDVSQNPSVEEGMSVHVPPRGESITLSGAVRRPGDYELGRSPSLRDLLDLTGGLLQTAAPTQARLTRVLVDGRRETVSVDLTRALVPPADVVLRPGDLLFVPTLLVLQDVVEVRGAFNGTTDSSRTMTAGKATIVQRLELAQGDRVKDVVGRAGGAAAYAELRLASVERSGGPGPRQRIPIDLHRLLVDKDDSQNILLDNGDVLLLPVAEDKVYVLGEVRSPGPLDFRPDLTPREYVALAGGPTVRGRFKNATVTFANGRSYALASAPPLEPGVIVTVPEVSVRWWQDYVQIAGAIAGFITTYTGLFLLFGGRVGNN